MSQFVPRQGIFAVVLLASFFSHALLLVFSTEKAQHDYRRDKATQIVNQLSQEAQMAMASKDKVSLSVIANRYQTDSDVAKLVITDADNQTLVQTGQAVATAGQTGEVVDKMILQDKQPLGHLNVTMQAVSKGEIISKMWTFLLGSAIIHAFILLLYGYLARPTKALINQLGEKIQEKLTQQYEAKNSGVRGQTPPTSATPELTAEKSEKPVSAISSFLQTKLNPDDKKTTDGEKPKKSQPSVMPMVDSVPVVAQIQVRFFDEYNLLNKLAPEVAMPYLQLCEDLLKRACDSLLVDNPTLIARQLSGIEFTQTPKFEGNGASILLKGKPEQLALACVLLGKLVVMLNQIVYEKHRELSRFALPVWVGASLENKAGDMQKLMLNHAKADSILLLFSIEQLKSLEGQVQLKNQPRPTNLSEREMAWYDGMAEHLILNLMEKRNQILSASAV